ncbi:MAG: S-adenosylmethionine decarboxylase proenzyme [Gammaproteobacteria bacterium]|nr:S-adenosylmethionine decarboxylase proenzyme [Gammaproteobacteria bacterium]
MARKQKNLLLSVSFNCGDTLLGRNTALKKSIAVKPDRGKSFVNPWPVHNQKPARNAAATDHFVVKDGLVFAGTHLIIDFWGASQLNDIDKMEQALRESVEAANATLLHLHLHHFTPYEGISGVAVLAESHISVHTWPERGYAAFDVFMCGDADPEKTVPILKAYFQPGNVSITKHLRGVTDVK